MKDILTIAYWICMTAAVFSLLFNADPRLTFGLLIAASFAQQPGDRA